MRDLTNIVSRFAKQSYGIDDELCFDGGECVLRVSGPGLNPFREKSVYPNSLRELHDIMDTLASQGYLIWSAHQS